MASAMKNLSLGSFGRGLFWIGALGMVAYGLKPRPSGPSPGSKMPSVIVYDLEGNPRRIDTEGRPLLIEAFASWCAACRRSSSTLEAISSLGAAHDLDVIAVSLDSKAENAKKARDTWPIRTPVFHDESGEFSDRLSIRILPTYILVDAEGRIQQVDAGNIGASTFRGWLQASGKTASADP
jgi:thiol-disulfide isomerase/thioredoxin